MHARIDITEVEARTKIRAKYLRALENEEWSLLPGPVYVRSFLKTYGDYLGLDSRLLVDEFKRRYEVPSEHDQRALANRNRERDRDRDRARRPRRVSGVFASPIGLIVVSLVVIVVALYLIGSHNSSSSSASGTATPASGGTTVHPVKHKAKHRSHAGPGSRTSTSAQSTLTDPTTARSTAKLATLTMVPTSTIWVCVESAHGKALYTGEYSVGQSMPTETGRALLVNLGNDHVTMTVNGKPYTPPVGSSIGLKITAKGVTPLSTAPTCQ